MMSEIKQRLHTISKEQLVQLLQELSARHPFLLTEMVSILDGLNSTIGVQFIAPTLPEDSDDEVTEDWDFSGDDQLHIEAAHTVAQHPFTLAVAQYPLAQSALSHEDTETHHQRLEEYTARLKQQQLPQALFQDLTELIQEAIACIAQHDNHAALCLFALLLDERLLEHTPALTSTYEQMIDAAMYSLEALLSESSSNTTFDTNAATLSPLLTPEDRRRWLERLFALWLKRLDAHRVEEDLPELMLDVAWNEDMLLLRSLTQNELQKQPHSEHSNIVDFARQYRTKALEKFLKELP